MVENKKRKYICGEKKMVEFIRILCVYNIWYIVNVMYNVKIENELLLFALLYKMNKINFI